MKFMTMMMMIPFIKSNSTVSFLVMVSTLFNWSLQKFDNFGLSYSLVLDHLSFWMINLSLWVIMLVSIMKNKSVELYKKMMSTLAALLLLTFCAWNFMLYYLMFEILLIMMFILMLLWGYQPERTESAMLMLIITLMFSMPFLTSVATIKMKLDFSEKLDGHTLFAFLSFMMAFMVKVPMFFIHMWLPKAHVESPTFGSMILASIMIKLGSYGMIRMKMMIVENKKFNIIIYSTAIWSAIILSMTCLIQVDLKSIIAYSSIVHMMIMMASIMVFSSKSVLGSVLLMLGHGLCSSVMFFILSEFYNVSKSRSIMMNKSVLSSLSAMSMMWFIACMNNSPMPPSMNMLAELMCLKLIIMWSKLMMIFCLIIMMVSAMYSIYLFYNNVHGKVSKLLKKTSYNKSMSMSISMIHMLPLMTIMIKACALEI